MSIITLTTDLGLKDYYVGAVKGAILSQLSDASIVDITHELVPFDIFQASYVVRNAYPNFPEGTVHIIGLNAQPDMNTPYIVVKANGHYFIGSDNGIFSLLFDKTPENIVTLTIQEESAYYNFPIRDVFVKAACHLVRGGTLEVIGTPKEKFNERSLLRPVVEGNSLRGTVIYIDSYGNVISNITKSMFSETGKGKKFSINFVNYPLESISNTYNDVPEGEILAMFNSAGYLELSINKGEIAKLLNISLNDIITVNFDD